MNEFEIEMKSASEEVSRLSIEARTALKEGRLDDAVALMERARDISLTQLERMEAKING